MMISGFDYLLQLQLKGCTGEVALPPLVGREAAIQPQPSNPAEIVEGAIWHTAFPANRHSNMSLCQQGTDSVKLKPRPWKDLRSVHDYSCLIFN